MSPVSRRVLAAGAALVLASGAGTAVLLRVGSGAPEADAQRADAAVLYSCPMHPSYHSDRPGNCPICSMKLVPLEAADPGAAGPGAAARDRGEAGGSAPGAARPAAPSIQISPERQQLIGVRFSEVIRAPATAEIRAVGKVAFDESRITRVHAKVNGWIEDVSVDFVGAAVRRGQPLFTLYSPELVASQEEYLLALRAARELGESSFERIASGSRALVQSARQRLRLWDMSPAQIRALERRGEVSRAVTVFAPASGVVTARAAYPHGRYVTPELELYTIAALDRVWVVASVYESDLPSVAVGQEAEAILPYDAAHPPLRGRVSFVQPYLDASTHTAQVRFDFPNADLSLRPESSVSVVLRKELGVALIVPRDAVMDTGRSQYVFVDRGGGRLEPRLIRTGAEVAAGRVALEGLAEGDRVVTAANFLVDSESRLQGAFDAMTRPSEGEAP